VGCLDIQTMELIPFCQLMEIDDGNCMGRVTTRRRKGKPIDWTSIPTSAKVKSGPLQKAKVGD